MEVVRFKLGTDKSILVEARQGRRTDADSSLVVPAPATGTLDELFAKADQDTDNARSGISARLATAAEKTLQESLSTISPMIDAIHDAVANVTRPVDAVEISFGVKLTAGAQAILSAGTEANIEFKISWKLDGPEKT